MSKKVILAVMALVVALALPAFASANKQGISAVITPSKLSKKKFKPATINVTTTTSQDKGKTGANAIDPAYRAKVYFDKDITFSPTGVFPTCKFSKIEGVSDAKVLKKACGKTVVGKGTGQVALGGYIDPVTNKPPPDGSLNAKITAYNGVPKGKKPVILLHSIVPGVSVTTLIGTLKKTGGKYHNLLDVAIEPLPGGTAITRFQVKVHATAKKHGKKYSYVSAKCSHKKFSYKGTFFFKNPSTNKKTQATATDTSKCKGK